MNCTSHGSSSEQQQLAQPEWSMNSQIYKCPFRNGYADSYGKVLNCYNLSLIFKSMRNTTKASIPTCRRVLFISRSYRLCERGQYFGFHSSYLRCFSSCAILLGTSQRGMCSGRAITKHAMVKPKSSLLPLCTFKSHPESPGSAGIFLLSLAGVKWEKFFLSKMFP